MDKKHNYNIQGIGLGLTIVTKLLELMDSKLNVESEYGKGSRFSFCVAQKVIDDTPVGKIKRNNESYSLEDDSKQDSFTAPDARILAADDNIMNLNLLKGILKETQIKMDLAANGQEALDMLKSNRYSVILLDHMMPVMDGMEALKIIKEENLAPGTPVIVLTANAVSGVRGKYIEAGFDDYLAKPIIGKQLRELILKYLPDELVNYTSKGAVKQESTQAQEKSFLDSLDFLDTATGMTYCCDSEDFYKEMLGSYLDTDKTEDVDTAYMNKDWKNYRIFVHALKSTSLSIGAVDVSEEAKQLENASKNLNTEFIEEHHSAFMVHYCALLKKINGVLNGEPDGSTKEEKAVAEETANILVVDDDAMNLKIAEKMLQQYFNVSCVKSGIDALKYVQTTTPDLILLDLHMPEMDGFEVLKELKEDKKSSSIPIIFLTADNDRDVEVRGFKEGALDFITKPFIADIMI